MLHRRMLLVVLCVLSLARTGISAEASTPVVINGPQDGQVVVSSNVSFAGDGPDDGSEG